MPFSNWNSKGEYFLEHTSRCYVLIAQPVPTSAEKNSSLFFPWWATRLSQSCCSLGLFLHLLPSLPHPSSELVLHLVFCLHSLSVLLFPPGMDPLPPKLGSGVLI